MGDRGYIPDANHVDPRGLEGADSRLSPATGASDKYLHLPEPVLYGFSRSILPCPLSGKGSPFSGALESYRPSAAPGEHISPGVC